MHTLNVFINLNEYSMHSVDFTTLQKLSKLKQLKDSN